MSRNTWWKQQVYKRKKHRISREWLSVASANQKTKSQLNPLHTRWAQKRWKILCLMSFNGSLVHLFEWILAASRQGATTGVGSSTWDPVSTDSGISRTGIAWIARRISGISSPPEASAVRGMKSGLTPLKEANCPNVISTEAMFKVMQSYSTFT